MRKIVGFIAIIGSLFPCVSTRGQSSNTVVATRDSQALSIITECLRLQGDQAISKVQDFKATGKITYFGGSGETTGEVTIEGKGTHSYQLSAKVPKGTQRWSTHNMKAFSQKAQEKLQPLSAHNSINLGALTFPLLNLYEAYTTPSVAVSFFGKTTRNGQEVYQIRTQRNFQEKEGFLGTLSKLSVRDYFIDSKTFAPVGSVWMSHPPTDFKQEFSEELWFADFTWVDGVAVPLSVTEYLAGQKRWTLQIEKHQFNVGMTDSAFEQ